MSITGTLVDAYSGNNVPKAQIRLIGHTSVPTVSDDYGLFILQISSEIFQAMDDSVRLEIHHDHYLSTKITLGKQYVKPANKERESKTFLLIPKVPLIIRGRVTNKGEPVCYIEISVYSKHFVNKNLTKNVITDKNGRFQIAIRHKEDINYYPRIQSYEFILDFIDPRHQYPNKTNIQYKWLNTDLENNSINIELSNK